LQLINQKWTCPEMDRWMAAMSSLNLWFPLIVIAMLGFLCFGGAKGRAFAITVAAVIALNDGVVVQFGKKWFQRPRPNDAYVGTRCVGLASPKLKVLGLFMPLEISTVTDSEVLNCVGGKSFPSGHTSNMVAVGIVMAYFFGKRGWLFMGVAGMVSYSRIYVGSHWPTDVMLSMILGTLLAFLMLAIFRAAWLRFGPTWLPTVYEANPELFPELIQR